MMSRQLNRLKLLEELLTNEGIARKIKGRGQWLSTGGVVLAKFMILGISIINYHYF